LASQALMIEGFAGHFLADCFAAGHLTPHALGRVATGKELSKFKAGAMVNTWHDIFNAIPEGVPTTLGRFHGDYSMDGHDLEYVSSVLCNSLLEVAMPWYAGYEYDAELVLPKPDVGKIMEDPVVGPLWAQMTKDYSGRMRALAKLQRRGGKTGLSKYTIYETTTGEQASNDEAIAPILAHVFGGRLDGPELVRDTSDIAVTRGKVKKIVEALHSMLGYRGGWQPSSGLSKDFEELSTEEKKLLPYKFRIDLQSDNPLKRHTPATPPLEPLLAELKFWIETWEEQATT
ncbi:MAG: hypothetical protein KC457_34905, partial [Myxococcales bacterium]|nr:hypothetical protein [Myxococcales bacterium]